MAHSITEVRRTASRLSAAFVRWTQSSCGTSTTMSRNVEENRRLLIAGSWGPQDHLTHRRSNDKWDHPVRARRDFSASRANEEGIRRRVRANQEGVPSPVRQQAKVYEHCERSDGQGEDFIASARRQYTFGICAADADKSRHWSVALVQPELSRRERNKW